MHHEILAPAQHGEGGATPCATSAIKTGMTTYRAGIQLHPARASPCFGLDYLRQAHRLLWAAQQDQTLKTRCLSMGFHFDAKPWLAPTLQSQIFFWRGASEKQLLQDSFGTCQESNSQPPKRAWGPGEPQKDLQPRWEERWDRHWCPATSPWGGQHRRVKAAKPPPEDVCTPCATPYNSRSPTWKGEGDASSSERWWVISRRTPH